MSASTLPRAIVFPLGHPRAVAAVRSLGRAGVPVVGADRSRAAAGMHSRYLVEKQLLAGDPEGDLEVLLRMGEAGGGGVLVPTSDVALALVARHQDVLSKWYTCALSPWPVLQQIIDRTCSYRLAREAGLRTPDHWAPTDAAELERVLRELDFEREQYLVKSNVLDAPADPVTRRCTRVAGPTPDTLRERWLEAAARAAAPPIVEAVVPGEAECCIGVTLVIDREGEELLIYAVRRLTLQSYARGRIFRHPYELGSNAFCETLDDPEAVALARAFVRHVGLLGAITVEFRRDPRDGSLTFVKCDPRTVRATSLSARIGRDVPTAVYAVATGRREVYRPRPGAVRTGVAWLWVRAWLEAVGGARRDGAAAGAVLELARRLPRVRAFGQLSLRDPLPFARDVSTLLSERSARPLRRRLRRMHERRLAVHTVADAGRPRPGSRS